MKFSLPFTRRAALAAPPATSTGAAPLPSLASDRRSGRRGVTDAAVSLAAGERRPNLAGGISRSVPPLAAFSVPKPAPGVVPDGAIAMDSMPVVTQTYNWALQGMWAEGLGFLGYPYLAELTQRAEYRRPSEILAKEMTRRWVRLTATGDTKAEKLKQLTDAMERFRVRKLFAEAAQQDGFFGRSQLFIAMKNAGPRDPERKAPLILDPGKIDKGGLDYFRLVEPYWAYPGMFNADRPLEEDFYRPQQWFVMSDEVHVSRLIPFVGRAVPDILKPAYQFGGLSLTQMSKPYVDNWLRTRQSVSDIVQAFSVMVLKTDMSQVLNGGSGADLTNRVAMFNNYRSNSGTFVIDKDAEDFANVSAPLSGLDELQAQAQEHMASVVGIPLIILLGIDPAGLNASSEGSLKTFYAWVKSYQEHLFGDNLRYVLDLLQLNEFGQIDPDIGFEFIDLWEPTETERATIRKTDADTDAVYIDRGVVSPEEVREALAENPSSPYGSVDLSGPPPEPPADPTLEGDPDEDDDEDTGDGAKARE